MFVGRFEIGPTTTCCGAIALLFVCYQLVLLLPGSPLLRPVLLLMEIGEEALASDVSDDDSATSTSSGSDCHKSDCPPAKKPFKPSSTSSTSPGLIFRHPAVSHVRLPHSSGVIDFTEWVISTVLSDDDRKALARKVSEPVPI